MSHWQLSLMVRLGHDLQISGPALLPVSPGLQQALDRSFDSVYALFDFSINVTVSAAAPAPVFPLAAGSLPAGAPSIMQCPACWAALSFAAPPCQTICLDVL